MGAMSILPFLAQPVEGSVVGSILPLRADVSRGTQGADQSTLLNQCLIVTDRDEPSYIQYGTKDLSDYLKEITRSEVPVRTSLDPNAESLIVVGKRMAEQVAADVLTGKDLGEQGFVIKSITEKGKRRLIVTGTSSIGTNYGLAAVMRMINAEGNSAYLEGPLDIRSKPSFALRGIHLNGWPFSYPYAFRAWQEKDWKQFIDIIWYQGANLFFLWPFMEIMPVPLSAEDEAYLQEVRRVVDYAQKQRGMEVWIMHSANRIGTSDCGDRDPRSRAYWVNQCQKDMNPADPQQFEKIMKSFEGLYRTVDNADGFGMIDSDPGGWPQSPISDQVRIFKGARALLDQYNLKKTQAKLIDWMWLGWGRHKFFSSSNTVVGQYDWTDKNPDAGDVAFMEETIRAFRKDLPEPWWLIVGFSPYLRSSQEEHQLQKAVFMPYGAIEDEPSFPSTNVPFDSVRKTLDVLSNYPGTRGLMGNNQTSLLQLPRTYYFLSTAWDYTYRSRNQRDVLLELSGHLYPEQKELIADCILALEETDPRKIHFVLDRLEGLVNQGTLGRPGVIGRRLFPDYLQVAKDLVFQLKIRAARQQLLQALFSRTDKDECEKLIEDYFDLLLAWDHQTGWEKMINIGIWQSPIYASDKRFQEAFSILKRVIGGGARFTNYAAIASFFEPISKRLLQKYGEDAVMIGCIEPLKTAILQAP
jgi:hypothetical protein